MGFSPPYLNPACKSVKTKPLTTSVAYFFHLGIGKTDDTTAVTTDSTIDRLTDYLFIEIG